MTPAGKAIFRNLPQAARWQATGLWRHERDGYMIGGPWDCEECVRFGNLPEWADRSYAVRAVNPCSLGGPAFFGT